MGLDANSPQMDEFERQIEEAYHKTLKNGGVLPYWLHLRGEPRNTLSKMTGSDIFTWAESCNSNPSKASHGAFPGDGFEIEYQPSEHVIEAGSDINSIIGTRVRSHKAVLWGAEQRRQSLKDVIKAPNKKYKSVLGDAGLWVAVGVHEVAILGIDLHSVVYQGKQFRFRNINRVVFFVNPPFVKGMPPPQVYSFQNPANIGKG